MSCIDSLPLVRKQSQSYPASTLTVRGSTLVVRICRHQILTTEVDPRTGGVEIFIMAVDP